MPLIGSLYCPNRYVPLHHLREPSQIQKIKLQEKMSGIKEHPELTGLSIKNKYKFRRTKTQEILDPVTERK